MPEFVYTLNDLRKVVDQDRVLINDLTLAFLPGAKIGVVCSNGSGKSTLLRIMAGVDKEYVGEARPAPGLRIGYLQQEPELDPSLDVRGNVELGAKEIRALLTEFDAISAKFAEPMSDSEMEALLEKQAKLQDRIDASNAWELDRTLEIAMQALHVPPGDSDVTKISGGEKRRVALCRLLLERPDLLLLDEPTNHLDAESVSWLEEFLATYPGTVVAVTHDRYFLENVAQWILELDRGNAYPYKGNYSEWLQQKRRRIELEERKSAARSRSLDRELEWIRMTPRARQAKGKARLRQYDELRSEEEKRAPESVEITIPQGPRLGEHVIKADKVGKGFGGRTLIRDLTFSLPPGGIVGVIGPNGAGKTTLFRMIAGLEKADSGELTLGPSAVLAYVNQERSDLDPEATVWQAVSGGADLMRVGKRDLQTRAYVASFGFRGPEQQKRVHMLSGGERNRLHLSRLLKEGANVVLLDEPSNDLDVDTLRALEEALLGFSGCVVVISHDRWFLDRIATHILAFEGDGHVEWFEGNYQEYSADLKRRGGA